MFDIIRIGNRLDLNFNGKLDRAQMEAVLNDFETKSTGIEHGVMRYRITGFQFPSIAAIAVELSRLPLLFRIIRQFDRAVILADESWIRRFSEWEGKLIPGFEIKAFPLDQEEAADRWLTAA